MYNPYIDVKLCKGYTVRMIIYVNSKYKPRRKSKKRNLVARTDGKTKPIDVSNRFNPVASGLIIRETPYYPSLKTDSSGSTTKENHPPTYTGDKMIGIGTLHKSNGVPLFRQEDLEDQAKMRR